MPVSATAILASGSRALFAASAAAVKILSTCSCEYVAKISCAFLTSSIFAIKASTESTIWFSMKTLLS